MWHRRTHPTIHTLTHTHTRKRRRSRLGSITVFTWARLPSKKVLFYRNQGGCRCFQRWLYLHIRTRVCTFLLFHCLGSVAQIWASESLALSAIGSASRVIPNPPTIPQPAVSIPPPSEKSLQHLLKIISRMFKAFDSVLLSKTHFEGGKNLHCCYRFIQAAREVLFFFCKK